MLWKIVDEGDSTTRMAHTSMSAHALAFQKNKNMAQKTSTVLRFVAVSGTLVIVGLIGIRLVFVAGGLINEGGQPRVGAGFWEAAQSLARVLLLLVFFGYMHLFQRKVLPALREWDRRLFLVVAFVLGLLLAAMIDSNVGKELGNGWPRYLASGAELLVGFCIAMLVFLPESLRDLVQKEISPANPGLEESVLSFYFGLLLGLLVYLVALGFFPPRPVSPPPTSAWLFIP